VKARFVSPEEHTAPPRSTPLESLGLPCRVFSAGLVHQARQYNSARELYDKLGTNSIGCYPVEDGKLSPCNSYIITQTPMGLPKAKWLLWIGMTLLVVLGFAGLAIFKASRALRQARSEVAAEENLKFAVSRLNRAAPPGVEWISSPAAFNDAAFFWQPSVRLRPFGPH